MKPKTPFEEIDHKSILKKMIILCWVCLGVCLLVKIFGGKSFEILIANPQFLKLCELIDSNLVCLRLIEFAIYIITTLLYFTAIISHPPKYLIYLCVGLCIIKNVSLDYGLFIGNIIEILITICLPLCYKTSVKDSIIHFVGVNLFQVATMFIRNLSMPLLPDYTLVGVIMSIDYIILLVLLNLYKKGGITYGSLGSVLFQRRDSTA